MLVKHSGVGAAETMGCYLTVRPEPMTASSWHRFRDGDVPDEGRVRAAVVENGLLRRPWHGHDYDPLTNVPPLGFADAVPAFAVQEREDGAWVELKDLPTYVRTVGDVVVETLVAWGVTQVFGMVGHSMHPLLPAAMPSSPDARISGDRGTSFHKPADRPV